MVRSVRAHMTYANVTATLALVLSLSGGVAYANHLLVRSSDIVDGEVRRNDLHASSVNSAKVADGSITTTDLLDDSVRSADIRNGTVTGADLKNDSVTGADIDEQSLAHVAASKLDGLDADQLIRVTSVKKRVAEALPDCSPGLDYLVHTFSVPTAGYVHVNAAFTAAYGPYSGEQAFAARIERTSPSPIVGEWMEDMMESPSGRYSIPMVEVFPVAAGSNTFALHVCDEHDLDNTAIAAQMAFLFTPFGL